MMLVVFLVSCGSKEDDQNAENTNTKTLSLKAAVPGTSQEIPTYDPDGGGWEVEKWNHKISKSLKELSSKLINDEDWQIYADSMCNEFEGAFFQIPKTPKEITRGKIESFNDPEVQIRENSFSSGISTLLNSVSIFDNLERVSFKIINIDKITKRNIQSDVIVHFAGAENNLDTELRGNIKMLWSNEKENITLLSVRGDFSASLSSLGKFTDVTESTLGEVPEFKDQFYRGQDYWTSRIEMLTGIDVGGWQGVSVADVNGDGLDDFFLCQEPGLPNRLFIQEKDGQAVESSKEWGIDWIEDSRSSIIADFDNDGDQDLAVACYGMVVIAENVQEKRFEPAAILKTSWSTSSLAAADYDNDGLIDLYVCAYVNEDNGNSIGTDSNEFVYHDAENGAPNTMYKNVTKGIGKISFLDVTDEVGLNVNNSRWSFAASWEDYDNDGDQDLYVANDYGRNNLYNNDKGKFTDLASKTDSEDSASGMSVSWADYDKDGNMDVYISNMFSAAGNRITNQKQFKSSTQQSVRERFRRFARGNTLLRNVNGNFQDTSLSAGVNMGRWAWGSNFIDFNNDTLPDLVVANGYLTSKSESGDL